MQRLPPVIVFVLLMIAIVIWHSRLAFIQFGGFDGGYLINVAWAQYTGLAAYRDFSTPMPALFVYPAGWAFLLGGPSWGSLTALVCVFSVLTSTWIFALLIRATGKAWASLFFTVLLQAMTFLPLSWWWYNQITAVIEAIYLGSVFFLLLEPGDRYARASFWLAVALTGLAKANTAGLLLILTHLILLTRPSTRLFVLVASASATAFDAAFLFLEHASPVLLLQNYSLLSARLISTDCWQYCLFQGCTEEHLPSFIANGCLAMLILHAICCHKETLVREGWHTLLLLIFGVVFVVGAIGMITDSDLKMTEAAPMMMIVPFLQYFLRRGYAPMPGRKLAYAYIIFFYFIAMSLFLGITRARVFSIGKDYFAEDVPLIPIQSPAFFRGMQVGPKLNDVLKDVNQVLLENGIPGTGDNSKKIFFGPRIDFCYAAYHLSFEPGLPICWEKIPSSHHGEEYPTGIYIAAGMVAPSRWIELGEPPDPRVMAFIHARFDLCIFVIGYEHIADMSYIPADIRAELHDHYKMEYRDRIVVFTRKDDSP
ncbi:MAG TPA: hypothetical protein VL981_09495 [Candidatus Methylacidiphilales bacterium]|nr:hypothetical protein [Candidatus Methylacidiphilales bacterium]